jgi:hypothetical protein
VRVVFEGIGHDVEQWCQLVIQQIDTQLRDRRQALVQRRESLTRIRQAEDGLERSIAALESLDVQCERLAGQLQADVDKLRQQATVPPAATAAPGAAQRPTHLQLVHAMASVAA